MKHLEIYEKYNDNTTFSKYKEIWEVDDNIQLTGFSIDLFIEEIYNLTKSGIIFFDQIDKNIGDEPLFYEKDREIIEEIVSIRINSKKYNL